MKQYVREIFIITEFDAEDIIATSDLNGYGGGGHGGSGSGGSGSGGSGSGGSGSGGSGSGGSSPAPGPPEDYFPFFPVI